VLEALTSGFYVNVTRSLAPIFLAVVGYDILDIVELNAKAYLFATLTAYVVYRYRELFVRNVKIFLITFHALERLFWGLIPISQNFKILPIVYTLAVCFTVPTSSLINVAIFSLERDLAKRTLALRSSLGSFSNVLGSTTSLIILYTMVGFEKYTILYFLASLVGFTSTTFLSFASIRGELEDVGEEVRVRYASVLLFLTLVTASSSLIGLTWTPHLIRDLGVEDHFAMTLSFLQTLTAIFAPLFWSGRRYETYRISILIASTIPIAIQIVKIPTIHLSLAVLYSFSFNGVNMLSSFICAEIKGREIPFLLTTSTSLSQLFGMTLAIVTGDFGAMMKTSTILLILALFTSLLTIPEISFDVERARVYSRIVYDVTLSGYSFSTTLARETTLLALRLTVLSFSLLLIIFIYRVVHYLSL